MSKVFLTGATGLIGASVAQLLLDHEHEVRAVVRDPGSADGKAIEALGVEVVKGDITDGPKMNELVEGMDAVIHSAAMLGGPDQSMVTGFETNVLGTVNVLSAAALADVSPVVQLSTTTFFNMWNDSLTEYSQLDLTAANRDPYSMTKRLAYEEGISRIQSGQDIRIVIPGGVFGPSPCIERAMTMPSFNERIVAAIHGEFDEIVAMPIPWVYVGDVAAVVVGALEKGVAGERYLAFGRPQDVGPMSLFCNRAAAIAGSEHKVFDIPTDRLDDPEIIQKYGESWTGLGKRSYPEPWFVYDRTISRLGHTPISLDEGLELTIPWLRSSGLL